MTPPIVGLTGYAGVGKDAAAAELLRRGWERRSFADVLRRLLEVLDPWVCLEGDCEPLSRRLGDATWDQLKRDPRCDARALLQRAGDAIKASLGDDAILRVVLDRPAAGPIVVTDVRFPEEADAIRARGGLVIRVIRPGVGPRDSHRSETAMDGYVPDAIVRNDGGLELLWYRVLRAAGVIDG